MSKKKEDLSVDGPGSPVSIKKFNGTRIASDREGLTVLIDDGIGFAFDDPEFTYITPEECAKQAVHYVKAGFNEDGLPAYLYRYISYMFGLNTQFKTNQEYVDAVRKKEFTKDNPDFKEAVNKVKYCENNTEAKQIIGFVQLFAGCLNMCKKEGKPAKLFLHEPDSFLHPKRSAKFMSLIKMIEEDYKI